MSKPAWQEAPRLRSVLAPRLRSRATIHDQIAVEDRRLFIFGVGYVATGLANDLAHQGWRVDCTCRSAQHAKHLQRTKPEGWHAHVFDPAGENPSSPSATGGLSDKALDALRTAPYILTSIPPLGLPLYDPVLRAQLRLLRGLAQHPTGPTIRWLGYLSSTSVYGDWGGDWVDEASECRPATAKGVVRLEHEHAWRRIADEQRLPLRVFRLGGIYGPGRSVLEAVRREMAVADAAPTANKCADGAPMTHAARVLEISGRSSSSTTTTSSATSVAMRVSSGTPSATVDSSQCFDSSQLRSDPPSLPNDLGQPQASAVTQDNKRRRGAQRYTSRCHVLDISRVLQASIAAAHTITTPNFTISTTSAAVPSSSRLAADAQTITSTTSAATPDGSDSFADAAASTTATYNVADDDPAPRGEVMRHARLLLGLTDADEGSSRQPPLSSSDQASPVDLQLPSTSASVTTSSSGAATTSSARATGIKLEEKRVRNTLIKAELGVRLEFPTYREALAAMVAGDLRPFDATDLAAGGVAAGSSPQQRSEE